MRYKDAWKQIKAALAHSRINPNEHAEARKFADRVHAEMEKLEHTPS